jgi:hypothetical protein
MAQCSITRSAAAKNWPDGIISVKITMNPYVFAMAEARAYERGLQPWELICEALWDKLGGPSHEELMAFAADLELCEDDPKWKKRLQITARHEVEISASRKRREAEAGRAIDGPDDGDGKQP